MMWGYSCTAILWILSCSIQQKIIQAQPVPGYCDGSSEFLCANYQCIIEGFACDGENDCGDYSDEINCPPATCGGQLTATTGVILSRYYPSTYPNNEKCTWIIRGSTGSYIQLLFTNFTLEESQYSLARGGDVCYDWLEIVETKSSDSDRYGYCGSLDAGYSHASSGNYLWLQFRSDESRAYSGFRIEYHIVTCSDDESFRCNNGHCVSFLVECNGDDDCGDNSDEQGCLTRECIPGEYRCAAPGDRRCIRDFEQCDGWEDCADGADEINCQGFTPCNGDYDFRCDNGQCIYDGFRCDSEDDCGDNSDERSCSTSATCDDQLTATSGVITTPNFPLFYPSDAQCTWIIQGPTGTNIQLTFSHFSLQESEHVPEFGVNVCYDWLQILETKESEDTVYCGNTGPQSYTSTGNYLWIQFRSDEVIVASGFRAEYEIVTPGPCQGIICYNGGTCNPIGSVSFNCQCQNGYTGSRCETVLDPCQGMTCYNGGWCVSGSCVCQSGYTGQNCQTVLDPCQGMTCYNGGWCVSGSCVCQSGYTGQNCQTVLDPCQSVTCYNTGQCVSGSCVCQSGYTGQYCQTDINECSSNPCQNGGLCADRVNGFNCTCLFGFEGIKCEVNKVIAVVVSSNIILEEKFMTSLLDRTSSEYQKLAEEFETLMKPQLLKYFGDGFEKCEVTAIRNGSVEIDFDVYINVLLEDFTDPSKAEEQVKSTLQDAIQQAIESGSLGRFAVKPESFNVVSVSSSRKGTDTCGDPGDIDNGFVILDKSEPFVAGKEVSFLCREGYTLDGESEIFCNSALEWSDALPKCTEDVEKSFIEENILFIGVGAGGGAVVLFILITVICVVCRKRTSEANEPAREPSVHFHQERTPDNKGVYNNGNGLNNTYQRESVDFRNPGYLAINDRAPLPVPRPDTVPNERIYDSVN